VVCGDGVMKPRFRTNPRTSPICIFFRSSPSNAWGNSVNGGYSSAPQSATPPDLVLPSKLSGMLAAVAR